MRKFKLEHKQDRTRTIYARFATLERKTAREQKRDRWEGR